jgi:AraC-like DNA-binding protein
MLQILQNKVESERVSHSFEKPFFRGGEDLSGQKDIRDVQHYEAIEHREDMPFSIFNIKKSRMKDENDVIVDVMDRWHPELEIVYTFAGHAKHYIDGQIHVAAPNRLFIVNSESIHKVISDKQSFEEDKIVAVSINIKQKFVKDMIPDIDQRYFLAEPEISGQRIGEIMREFSACQEKETQWEPYEGIRLTGLLCEMLSILCQEALVKKTDILPLNNQKNLERLRGIMQYVGDHYAEPITQHEVAEKFYFTKEYFSRFFKQNTGMTFGEYLTQYRLNAARKDLLESKKSILEIAVNHGFADAGGYIKAFKKIYGTTPLQYRKSFWKE